MAGRALAFADPEIIRMASHDFIPVAGDDWYQRRRQDAEGEFFRSVADQGPRKGAGGATRQGIYCLTASGKLLAYKNAGQNPQVMREVLRDALVAWNRLPSDERRPGAVEIPPLERADDRYTRTLAEGGLVVNVYTRALERNEDRTLETCSTRGTGYEGFATALDHLWLTEADGRSLLPDSPREGQAYPLAPRIAERILRFHLVDNTRGEPPFWRADDIRSSRLTVEIEAVTPEQVRLRLEGQALLATDADPARAERGYDASLLGWITFDRKRQIDAFDIVALGEHWGEGPYTRGARPGRTPLAIVMQLTAGDSPADRVPPAAMRNPQEYLSPSR
ncbi:MAG: hypothetical protein WD278_17875 [Pirellulales bacterium]